MALVAVALFVYLTRRSGLGLLPWLLDPRYGYQYHRVGLGHLYVASLAIWNFIFLYFLFFKVKKVAHLISATIAFVSVLYFYGSKGLVVFAVLESVVYYNFFINKIKLCRALILFGLIVAVFSFIFSLYSRQNTDVFLGTKILRYADYYNNARMFFADFDEDFEYAYGKEYLSGLWKYVPRAAYSNKPFSYGIVKYVVEKYYPGAGESGHTPAFGGPVESYLNFGFTGVILIGFIAGYFSALFYRYFLKYRNFLGFVLLSNVMGFSIFPIITGNLYKVLWYVFNILLLLFHKQMIRTIANSKKDVLQ
jgi:oligosaccharide repeat unit polymerase